jgi:SAM-dependent methyltransferase
VITLFDEKLAIRRKLRASGAPVVGADFLMQRAADDLADRLSTVMRAFETPAAINCLTPLAARAIVESGKAKGHIIRIEQDAAFLGGESGGVAQDGVLPLEPASIDLAISLLTLHEVNDLPGMLIQIARALRPDGLFIGALPGFGTLEELRQSLLAAEIELSGGATPRIYPFVDVRDAGALLQRAGFALPVADVDETTVRYDSMFHLMNDLRAMGATNALAERSRLPATRKLFSRAAQIYAERFSDPDGRIRATFNTVWFSGWAAHASQPKPLRPGSAKVSLKDMLGD